MVRQVLFELRTLNIVHKITINKD